MSTSIEYILKIVCYIPQVIIALYLLIPTILLILYFIKKILGLKSRAERAKEIPGKQINFAVVITAHEDTRFINPIIDSLLKQRYPNYIVYVVADGCDVSQLKYSDEKIVILRPEINLNSKVKSIHHAIESFRKEHEALVIFDVDNLVHPDFLLVMNRYFSKGFRAVQADFRAKNLNTEFARMDAIGDLYNFFTDREARSELGLSSAIWGSGICIDTEIYKNVTYKDNLGGFDKKLQLDIIKEAGFIAFAKEAILYDEKIASGVALEKQRTRWISSQFKYFSQGWNLLVKSIFRFRIDHSFFAFTAIRPPLVITLAFALIFSVIYLLLGQYIASIIWIGLIVQYVLAFMLIVAIRSSFNWKILSTLVYLPFFVARQFLALLQIGKAKKSFMKTENTQVLYIDEILKDKSINKRTRTEVI